MAQPGTVPAVLPPISTAAVSSSPQQKAASQQSTLYQVGSRLREYVGSVFAQRKPWNEMVDRTSFAKPANLAEATSRLRKNVAYFRINYVVVALTTVAVAFVLHPASLFVLAALVAAWLYVFVVRTGPLEVSGRVLSEREKFLAMSTISFVVVFFLTSVGNLVFSAAMLSAVLIGAHGATRVPDDLFLEDEQSQQGLLSIFTAVPSQLGANAV